MTGTYLKLPQRFIKEDLAVTKLYRDGNHAMGVSSKDSDENGIGSPPSYESEVTWFTTESAAPPSRQPNTNATHAQRRSTTPQQITILYGIG
jgi:hypothetical protein